MSLCALYDLAAPAKLNLFLHVIGRREDGYHLLQSAFILVDWCDTLHLERRGDGELHRHDLGPRLPADDLCLRAASALQRESGTRYGVDISIDKQVPWGAGMGGGSSDAATVLIGLNRLWELNWPTAQLLRLAAQLGADVPFFVGGQPAIVEGIGEVLTPFVVPPTSWAVVKPASSISTAAIFGSPILKRDSIPDTVMGLLSGAQSALNVTENRILPDVHGESIFPNCNSHDRKVLTPFWGRNDLQAAAEAACPEVAEVANWLESKYGNSRMTGSGSAVFARIDSDGKLDTERSESAETLTSMSGWQAEWVGRVCRSLDQHPLAGWSS
jgi:4-diphosphocytidyl-2-C-methyl-D-erythritol kinase